jgi:hypothetical protein
MTDDEPDDDENQSAGPRREDDPDPAVRRGGPGGGGDPSEWEAWANAFDEAEPDDPARPADQPTPSE